MLRTVTKNSFCNKHGSSVTLCDMGWPLIAHIAGFFLMTATAKAPPQRELVVLVLIDALRADHLSCYGYPRPTTPTIDTLAKQGTRYTQMFSNAPWTRPSTTCFLTGLNASHHQNETEKSKLAASIPTLAGMLKQAGWETAGFSANGNGGSLAGLDHGFDVFADPTNTYTKQQRGVTYNGLPTGEFLVDKALGWLAQSKGDKQFLFVFLVDPHDPYNAPPELEKQFLGADFSGKIRRITSWEYNNNYPADERFSAMAIYDAGIRYADKAVAQLLKGLQDQGRLDHTLLLLSADHGEGFGEHGFYLHAHQFWDEVIHIPLIIKGPGVEANKTDSRLAQSIDVAPTILKHAGVTVPAELNGHDLLAAPPPNSEIISEYNEFGIHRQAILNDSFKVIWQRPADEAWFMRTAKRKEYFPSVNFEHDVVNVFDRRQDSDERHDLAQTMPEPAQALLEKLRRFVSHLAPTQQNK